MAEPLGRAGVTVYLVKEHGAIDVVVTGESQRMSTR
jgi:hypothetical protein